MARILFPSSSSPGIRSLEGGGRLMNCYAEKLGEGAPAAYVIRRAPGLVRFATQATTGYRGALYASPDLYFAVNGLLKRSDSAGTISSVGSLSGTLAVTFARNNKTPTADNVVVSENGAFTFTTSAVNSITDPDLPQPNSVTFLDGFFFFTIADGRCFASGLNDVTINALDFIRAEAKSDGLVRGIAFDRDLYLFGNTNTEVWGGEVNASGFPFNRVAVIWRGLVGARAVAGWEDGFATFLAWVGDDNKVHKLVGYGTVPISPPELDRLIEATTDKTTIEAYVHSVGGHPCWVVSAPTFTWVYDLSNETWYERSSYLAMRWRLTGNTVNAFGGKWIGGDTTTGNLLQVTESVFKEDGNPLIYVAESIQMEAFSKRIRVPMTDFNFVRGTGIANGEDPIERNPMVEVQWSDDGGTNFSNPLLRELGPQAVTRGIVRVARTGLSGPQGRRWRLTVSDPVYVGCLGGEMQAEARHA